MTPDPVSTTFFFPVVRGDPGHGDEGRLVPPQTESPRDIQVGRPRPPKTEVSGPLTEREWSGPFHRTPGVFELSDVDRCPRRRGGVSDRYRPGGSDVGRSRHVCRYVS